MPSGRAGSGPWPAPRGVAAIGVFLLAFAIYVATTVRGLDYVDSGELAAVARTLGIAHPTGYPTFTLLGHLWASVVPLRPILALNLLAALLAAASA